MQSHGTIRIAIQKSGRLAEGSLALLRQMGLQFEMHRDRLFTQCRNMSVDILFLRDDDIPEYVQDGVADLGIVGSNIVEERRLRVERLLPLDFGFCTLSVAIPEQGPYQSLAALDGKKIATSYPATLKRFLRAKRLGAGIVVLRGSVEVAPALQVADAICDLVSTGNTLRAHHLRVLETISQCQAVLIGQQKPEALKSELIGQLLLRARGVQDARRYKYVMCNATEDGCSCRKPKTGPSPSPPKIPIYRNAELIGENRRRIFRRAQADIEKIMPDVRTIIDDVKKGGDAAVVEYVRKFDHPEFRADQIRVSKADIKKAYADVAPETLAIMKRQIDISRNFHAEQAQRLYAEADWSVEYVPGVRTGVRKGPIGNVGLYVPAGKAPLPTVAQILTVAAKAARVPRICVFFPPTDCPEIIVAADLAGADEMYRVGGVAAIAAMAYGTESIKPVDKIAGPGSPWVQAAKLQVLGQVGIDMLSGPSEGLGMVDDSTNPAWVALDILARCEHGSDSCFPIVTTSRMMAESIRQEIAKQAPLRKRYEKFIKPALANGYQAIILVDSIDEMIKVANEYGAEHLHIQVKNAEEVSKRIRNAGSIFIGPYAPVPVGDYAGGTNHCLPTSRAVAYSSPVGPETFMKNNEYQIITREGLQVLAPIVRAISDVEGLDGHKEAVDIRLRS